MKSFVATGLLGVFLTLTSCVHAGDSKVNYPEGYLGWAHIKSMIIEPGHALENPFQGLHHVYGNQKAIKGFEDSHFPDGSVLVFDLVQDKRLNKTIQEGERKLVGVMHKNKNIYGNTGGWGFEGFAGNSHTQRLVKDKGKSCFSCHESQSKHDFVFAKPRK